MAAPAPRAKTRAETAAGVVKRVVNPVLGKLGLVVTRREALERPLPDWVEVDLRWKLDHIPQQYVQAIEELEGCITESRLPPLPPNERRRALLADLWGTTISEALHIVSHLQRSLGLGGDVAEFGVAHGATSALLANELAETDKTLWLFDSFAGLPAPTAEDVLIDDWLGLGSMDAYEGTMAYSEDSVRAKLERIGFPQQRTRVVAGFVEDTIASASAAQFCFAYVDFDLYRPIRTVLEFMRDHLTPGGAIVVDDYGHFSAGAQQAVDELVASQPDFSLVLPPAWAGNFAILERAPSAD